MIATNQPKPAPTQPGVIEPVRERWSPRAYSDREVSGTDLELLMDAARWAASSYNEQPWRFVILRKGGPGYDKLFQTLVEFNQLWAGAAPVLMLTVTKKTFSHNGEVNRHAQHDAGQALAHILLQAAALGMAGHAMAGFDHKKAEAELGIPEDFEAIAVVTIGYAGAPELLPERMRKGELAPRVRKAISEIAFGSNWGTAAGF